MTLIISAKGHHINRNGERESDFIVLGCDSRGVVEIKDVFRTEVNNYKKLFPLNDYCCVMLSGDSESGLSLINGFLEKSKIQRKGVSDVVEEFCRFCRARFNEIEEFSLTTQERFPDVDFIIAGMDKVGNNFTKGKMFTLRRARLFNPAFCDDFIALGQNFLAYYFCEKLYKNDLDLDTVLSIVGQAIYDTMRTNGNVGGDITLAVIDSKKFRPMDTKDYIVEWEQQELNKIIHGRPSS